MSPEARATPEIGEKIVMATHCSHCGGACLLKVHVRDGVDPGGAFTSNTSLVQVEKA